MTKGKLRRKVEQHNNGKKQIRKEGEVCEEVEGKPKFIGRVIEVIIKVKNSLIKERSNGYNDFCREPKWLMSPVRKFESSNVCIRK